MTTTPEQATSSLLHSPQEDTPTATSQGAEARTMSTSSLARCAATADPAATASSSLPEGGGSVPREGVSRTLTGSGGRLDGETDTFVLPRDADPGEPWRCESDAGDEYADRGADR